MISAKPMAVVAMLAVAGAAVAYLLNFSGATDPATEAPQRVSLPEPPQARPVASMLDAVGDSDLAALRALYTPKVQDRISKKGWHPGRYIRSAGRTGGTPSRFASPKRPWFDVGPWHTIEAHRPPWLRLPTAALPTRGLECRLVGGRPT